ncbi:MAG: glycosyltransferase, partial [Clostridia bacterium]|nr:glycosyltransferase [Clostridia bacterium]
DGEIEKIILDNRGNKSYVSAASALNDGSEKATGDILIFMHQDVYLWDTTAIRRVAEYLKDNEKIILGAAGIAEQDGQNHYDIFMDKEKRKYAWGTGGKPLSAITLDECFIAMRKTLWQELKFDEKTCNDWHFYGADICYANSLKGNKNVIFPLEIFHDSFGTPSGTGFYNSALSIAKKYNGKILRIQTTCFNAKCSERGVKRYFKPRRLRNFFKKILRIIGLFPLAEKINKNRKKKKGLFVGENEN